jgi:hypothetical protein
LGIALTRAERPKQKPVHWKCGSGVAPATERANVYAGGSLANAVRQSVQTVERNLEEKRTRYLSAAELPVLIAALNNHDQRQGANIIRWLLLTGARRGESLSAKWSQIDFDRVSGQNRQRRRNSAKNIACLWVNPPWRCCATFTTTLRISSPSSRTGLPRVDIRPDNHVSPILPQEQKRQPAVLKICWNYAISI